MKNLTLNQMEVLNGGVCNPMNPNAPFPCAPDRCFGNGIAIIASGGNPNIPVVFCIA